MKKSEQGSFLQDLQRQFPYLFDSEASVEEIASDALVLMERDGIRLRFIRDRADFFLDVGLQDEPDTWYSFYDVLNVITAHLPLLERPVIKNQPGPVSKFEELLQ